MPGPKVKRIGGLKGVVRRIMAELAVVLRMRL
jgi:hypothetical protein